MAKPTLSQAGGNITENKPLFFGLIFLVLLIIYFIAAYFFCFPSFFHKAECDEESS